jgi:hypothetical protein
MVDKATYGIINKAIYGIINKAIYGIILCPCTWKE